MRDLKRLQALIITLDLARRAKITVEDGIWKVGIRDELPEWKQHEIIVRFRREFKSSEVTMSDGKLTISGSSKIHHRF